MKNKILPSMLNFQAASPHISFLQSPLYVQDRRSPWESESGLLRAGISSFGFSGTNCHLILESSPPAKKLQLQEKCSFLFTISAKRTEDLDALRFAYQRFLNSQDAEGVALGDICYTAAVGRGHYAHRLSVVAGDFQELLVGLTQVQLGRSFPSLRADPSTLELNRLGAAYANNEEVNWEEVFKGGAFHRIPLPTYPLRPTRYWPGQNSEPVKMKLKGASQHESGYTPNQILVATLWSQAMGLSEIDIHQSFYDMGADSIIATQVGKKLDSVFPGMLEVSDLFSYPTVFQLAAMVDQKVQKPSVNPQTLDCSQADSEGLDELLDRITSGEASVEDVLLKIVGAQEPDSQGGMSEH